MINATYLGHAGNYGPPLLKRSYGNREPQRLGAAHHTIGG